MRNMKFFAVFLVLSNFVCIYGYKHEHRSTSKLRTVVSWKQLSYDFDGVLYLNSTDTERNQDRVDYEQELKESEKFFIQYNNVPIGLEVFKDTVFVTVPRRRHGIPSTLNSISVSSSSSQHLKPYPGVSKELISVYRPRVDQCERLWVLDTGFLEVPGERKQVQPPAIVVFDLKTTEEVLRYELKGSDLVNEKTSAGLTSITIDVDPKHCQDAYAYINDLATEGLIVFSMKDRDSWRINHHSFAHDEQALNFSVAGHTINWKDGLFSIALSEADVEGQRRVYYHPLVSTQEFAVKTSILKRGTNFKETELLGSRGPQTQSGSHDYHAPTRTLLYANVAQDAILCWNVDTKMEPENVIMVAQDHEKLVYISDLKVVGDYVWVLVNQIPRFVYSTLNPTETNYYIHKAYSEVDLMVKYQENSSKINVPAPGKAMFCKRANIQDLIRGTVCDRSKKNH